MKDSALTQVLLKKTRISLKEEVIGFFKLRSLFAFSIAQVLVAAGLGRVEYSFRNTNYYTVLKTEHSGSIFIVVVN